MRRHLAFVLWLVLPAAAEAQNAPSTAPRALETAGFEDYRMSAGRMEGGVLRITLEARPARWQPWGPEAPAIYAHLFAADGGAPRAPGPLIRFTAGAPAFPRPAPPPQTQDIAVRVR